MLRNWKLKGVIQKGLSVVPGGGWINDRLQTSLGDLRDFDRNIDTKVSDWVGIMRCLAGAGRPSVEGLNILEMGSGWYPTLPVCLYLAGAASIHTADITRHMNQEWCFRMLKHLERQLDRISGSSHRDLKGIREQYQQLKQAGSLMELLAKAGIVYQAPVNTSSLSNTPDGFFDIVYTNSVLQNVPTPIVESLMQESWRVLKPNGLMLHSVGCGDQYAHFDRSISFVNYLQYTDDQWRFWNNDLLYQNRLRAPDYIRMAREIGFEVIFESRAVRQGTIEALRKIKLAPEFASYSTEDVAATTVEFVGRKQA